MRISQWWRHVQPHRLFVQIFFVMVISILAVTILTSLITIKISERLYMNTFSITNSKVIEQLNISFDTYHQSVASATTSALQSGTVRAFMINGVSDSLTMWKEYFSMHQQMDQIASNLEAYNAAIIFHGNNGRYFRTNRAVWDVSLDVLSESPITKTALAQPHRILYQYYEPHSLDLVTKEPMIVVTKAMYERRTSLQYGMMYIAMKEGDFRRFYESYTSKGNDIVILDRNGHIMSSNQSSWIGEREETLLEAMPQVDSGAQKFSEVELYGEKRMLIASHIPLSDLFLVNIINLNTFKNAFPAWTIFLICFVISTLAVLILYKIMQRLTKSLSRLVRQITNISKSEFSFKVAETGSYETRQIAYAFNAMINELQDYVDKLVETERKQREAELAALQQQINPHFLYNTLTSIKMLVKQGSEDKAANTINALISIMQNTIGNGREMISVKEEVENLRSYSYIKQVRYGDRIQVHYIITPECNNAQIPKLMLQPFVENSFFHAFLHKSKGNIYILIAKKQEKLVIEIADDGDGIQLESTSIEALPKSKRNERLPSGIGARNVHERLKLLYGNDAKITIHSKLKEGTQVMIQIPFTLQTNNNES